MPLRATAIILARAGSKGLPRKNALPVAAKPCVQWTIEHARQSHHIGLVALSTDDPELLDLAANLGIATVSRPVDLAHDTATIDSAARHALTSLAASPPPPTHTDTRALNRPDHPIVILYANVPVRPADLADRALTALAQHNADSVQSYAPVGKYHPWWTARIDPATGTVRPWEGDVLNHNTFRRQDLPPAFIPDGGVIAVRRDALMLELPGVPSGPHAFFGRADRRHGIISGPRGDEVVDIDSRLDLLVADTILRG